MSTSEPEELEDEYRLRRGFLGDLLRLFRLLVDDDEATAPMAAAARAAPFNPEPCVSLEEEDVLDPDRRRRAEWDFEGLIVSDGSP